MFSRILRLSKTFFSLIGLVSTFAFVLIIALFIFRPKNIETENTLVVGTASGYAPFCSITPDGECKGFDVDIAHDLANQLEKKLVLEDLGSMNTLFLALEQGTIDCVIWGLSITQSRMKKVAMVPYAGEHTTAYKMLFWQRIPEGISSIADMKNMTVCVEAGSSQEAVLDRYPSVSKKTMNSVTDALFALQQGCCDALLVEPAIAYGFKEKLPEHIKSIDLPLAPEDQVFGIGIAIKKDNTALIESIKKAIDAMKKNCKLESAQARWGVY